MLQEFDKITMSNEELLTEYIKHYPDCSSETCIPQKHIGFYHNIHFARLLMFRNQPGDRKWAEKLMTEVVAIQCLDDTKYFGCFPNYNCNEIRDCNSASFILPSLLEFYDDCLDLMNAEFRNSVKKCVDNTVLAVERRWDEELFVLHRDYVQYTNIFLDYCSCLFIAGKILGIDRLLRKAIGQWRRWFNHVAYYGIDEFLSPRYYEIEVTRPEYLCG